MEIVLNTLCAIALLTTLVYIFHGFLHSIDQSENNTF